ncbi:sensor histidine kinase [Streptomyces sp. ME19-01-6]|uniref:sensor histidine kinase n=1 Tax=Streptomyces sp. ME19-01-6 TaxID=3028686 RepID=UPI0029BCD6B1|nr:sensor histidine kinase [Streptomyces sp. ME19-01-6]MDX3227364.1 sensor histidine kinase [Streptomyces sp. ME19-01-6]
MITTESGRGGFRTYGADAFLWALLSAVGVLAWVEHAEPDWPLGLLLPPLALAYAIPAGRRRPGLAVLFAGVLCVLGLTGHSTPGNGYLLALAVTAFLLGIRSGDIRRDTAVLGAVFALGLALCAVLRVGPVWWLYSLTMIPAALLLPWLAGRYWQARRELVRGGWHRARVLEENQAHIAEQARLRERARIAADMHDSLGHELSLVALRAGALELSPDLTPRDREDLTHLLTLVSDAVDHLRDTIGVLAEGRTAGRGPEDSSPAVAPAETVSQLVDRVRESGVDVTIAWSGAPAPETLPPLADRAVHRVVQESLTNTIKHAPGSAVQVRLVRLGDATEVGVRNTGGGFVPPHPTSGHYGLTGLRERVRLLGGTFHAAPTPDGDGFEVRARIPDTPIPDHARPPAASAPETARAHTTARRRARLRLTTVAVLPVATGLIALASATLLAYQLLTCVLTPAAYATIEVGQERTEFDHLLPDRAYPYAPTPDPAGCVSYRSNSNLLQQVDLYRLCFSPEGRLTSKETIPGTGTEAG